MSKHHLDRETAERVSVGLIRLMKVLQAMRQHAPRIHPAVDATAYPILFNLAAEPRRVSALADCVHSDVSTVSRQVSALESHGLVAKVSDPEDRRAQVVRLSDEGQALLAGIQQQRTEWFRELMADWSAEEASDFAAHLERFGGALEQSREQLLARRGPASMPAPAPAPATVPAPLAAPLLSDALSSGPRSSDSLPSDSLPSGPLSSGPLPSTTSSTEN